MARKSVRLCSPCQRRYAGPIHACKAAVPDLATWTGRAGSAARHALEAANRERGRVDIGLVGLDNLLWAFDMETRAHHILAYLRQKRGNR